jgi:hypothetical protein
MSERASTHSPDVPRLRPRDAAWWPSPEVRAKARARIIEHPPEAFAVFEDYFFFIHIHPMNRWVHVLGMWIGLGVFAGSLAWLLAGSWLCVPTFLVGHLFFTGFGVLGHVLYDGTPEARTDRAYFFKAFPWILRINFETMTGRYPPRLAAFVERYPWVIEAWDLVDDR